MDNFIYFWLGFLILWTILYFSLHFKLNQPFGLVLFGLLITTFRLSRFGYQTISRPHRIKLPVRIKPIVEKISDYISAYQLKNTEVVLGMNSYRPIRIDLMDEHTMIAASTGGGKSWLLHSCLIQLFGKSSRFMDNVKVYVADFKGHPKDMWREWLPLLAGYAQRSDTGDISDCIHLLKDIDLLLKKEIDQRVLLIVEEASILTADKEGDELLGRIASQLRLNGSLIVTIQHPQYSKMQTFIKHNISRRIAGLVINQSQAEVILEVRPKEHDLPQDKGHYILREPGKRNLIKFKAMKPDLPEEIKTIVQNGINILAEQDERLRIFREVAQNKKKGAAITGAQTLGREFTWLNNAQFTLMVAYRNFAQAEAFIPPKSKGSHNHLACDFEEGFGRVKAYIEAGKWEKEAEKVI